jgi:thermostable 8-oxoguanine DNA glycosylase
MDFLTREEFENGLNEYDLEQRVFPAIAKRIEAGEELDNRDVLQILKWKLGRVTNANAKTVSAENLNQINEAIKVAKKPECGAEALEALDRIPGIGLATATAILTICYPEKFTILDWRALEMLQEATRVSADDWTASTYMKEYLPRVREQQALWACTLRDADRALWGLSVRKRITEVLDATAGL